eukprot:SAG31_NODE_21912_length_538_cov_0.697039_1_plen_132_part_01
MRSWDQRGGTTILCAEHPTVCGHAAIAAAVLPFVDTLTGWGSTSGNEAERRAALLRSAGVGTGLNCSSALSVSSATPILFRGIYTPSALGEWAVDNYMSPLTRPTSKSTAQGLSTHIFLSNQLTWALPVMFA